MLCVTINVCMDLLLSTVSLDPMLEHCLMLLRSNLLYMFLKRSFPKILVDPSVAKGSDIVNLGVFELLMLTKPNLSYFWLMWRHTNEGLSISFLGVFFPTSPLISLIFTTSQESKVGQIGLRLNVRLSYCFRPLLLWMLDLVMSYEFSKCNI